VLSSVRNLFILVSMRCKGEVPMCTNNRRSERTLFRGQKLPEAGDEEIARGRNARERDPRDDYIYSSTPLLHGITLPDWQPAQNINQCICEKPATETTLIYLNTCINIATCQRWNTLTLSIASSKQWACHAG
jgi:hypothetical protein